MTAGTFAKAQVQMFCSGLSRLGKHPSCTEVKIEWTGRVQTLGMIHMRERFDTRWRLMEASVVYLQNLGLSFCCWNVVGLLLVDLKLRWTQNSRAPVAVNIRSQGIATSKVGSNLSLMLTMALHPILRTDQTLNPHLSPSRSLVACSEVPTVASDLLLASSAV
jgi:hypothetical protein